MAVTIKECVATWAERWRNLKAWGRPLEEVVIVVRQRHAGNYSTGRAWPTMRRVVITACVDIVDSLDTVLHELAHEAAPGNEHHGPGWARRYAEAVTEVTGIAICPDVEKLDMDRQAVDALRSWWKTSGQAFAWEMAQGKSGAA